MKLNILGDIVILNFTPILRKNAIDRLRGIGYAKAGVPNLFRLTEHFELKKKSRNKI